MGQSCPAPVTNGRIGAKSDHGLVVAEALQTIKAERCAPKVASRTQRAETLASKINILLNIVVSESGKPFDYAAIRDEARTAGYCISRTRWSLLKHGKVQVLPNELLSALATVFDVDAEYLLQEDGTLPQHVEAKLELLRRRRRAEVRKFAAQRLMPVDPEAFTAIARILDEGI